MKMVFDNRRAAWDAYFEKQRRWEASWEKQIHEWLYRKSVFIGTYNTWHGRLWEIPFFLFLLIQRQRGQWGGPVRLSYWPTLRMTLFRVAVRFAVLKFGWK